MRIEIFLAATLAATLVAGCATHETKPNVANPYVAAVGGTTGSLSTDTDIQILSVSAGSNRPPDLMPDPTLLEPSLQTPATNPPLNAISLPNTRIPGTPVLTASLNPPDTMVVTAPAAKVALAACPAPSNAVQPRVWKINPLNP